MHITLWAKLGNFREHLAHSLGHLARLIPTHCVQRAGVIHEDRHQLVHFVGDSSLGRVQSQTRVAH